MTGDGETNSVRRVGKSESAFRTISEVADELDVPQHVLRFWESKFPQVKPMKRGGGRRYYRPEDVALLRRIRDLLYSEGYTIKGVQKLLREGGHKEPVGRAEAEPQLPLPTASPPDCTPSSPEAQETVFVAVDDGEDHAKVEPSAEEEPHQEQFSSVERGFDAKTREELELLLEELLQMKNLLQQRAC